MNVKTMIVDYDSLDAKPHFMVVEGEPYTARDKRDYCCYNFVRDGLKIVVVVRGKWVQQVDAQEFARSYVDQPQRWLRINLNNVGLG